MQAQPRDALVMGAILKDMGIVEHEPRVINQMLEFAYRYTTDIIQDAKAFAELNNRTNIDSDDVSAAIDNRSETTFAHPPPREQCIELAKNKNNIPLPPIKQTHGLRLPPDRHCLVQPNYQLRTDLPTAPIRINLSNPRGINSSHQQQIADSPQPIFLTTSSSSMNNHINPSSSSAASGAPPEPKRMRLVTTNNTDGDEDDYDKD